MADESIRRARRRAKLVLLLREIGGPAEAERQSGTKKSHFSAMTAGRRGLGDELAAKLERKFEKPDGWFDAPPEGDLSHLAEQLKDLSDSQREYVLLMLEQSIAFAKRGGKNEPPHVEGEQA